MSDDTIRIVCPACQHGLRVQAQWAGRTAKCPNCQTPFVITLDSAPSAPSLREVHPAPPAPSAPPGAGATPYPGGISLSAFRWPSELPLRTVCLVFTCILGALLVIGTFGIALIYLGIGLLANYITLALILAHIRGNGVKVGPDQLPQVYSAAQRACQALGLAVVPEVYVVQSGGILNAFATRWAYRNYVVIYSDLLEACGSQKEIDLIVGHEVGHLALGHILWHWLTLGGAAVPFLRQAYSRAREYSCDRCGWATCGSDEGAMRGLLILAAGGHCARMANLDSFLRQRQEVDGFWQTVVEWFQTHPWLTRRVEAIRQVSFSARAGQGAQL